MSDAKTYAAAAASNHASDAKQQQSPGKRKGSKILLCHSTSPSSEPNAQPRHQSRLGFGSKKAIWRTNGKDKNNERSNPDQEQEEKQLQKNKDAGAGESPDSFVPGPRYVESPIPFHKPNTNQEEEHVYVLTLQVTESIANPLNEMRGKHFPKHLNRTPAHLTLFHALPHSQLDLIEDNLAVLTWAIKPFHISTGIPFRMQRGVGVGLGDGLDELRDIRDALRFKWLPFLSDQDGGGWQPHWTVMNKVDEPKKVANAFDTIRRDLFENVQEGRAVGLDLWRYDKGSWEWVKEYGFLCNGNGPARISAGSPDLLGGEHRSSRLGSWSTGRKASESSQGKSQRRLDGQDGKVATLWGSLGFGRRS